MSSQHLDFTTALVTGGGGGIGKALSQWLIHEGKRVIIVGRTESTLRTTAQEIGAAAYYTLDTGNTKSIKPFVEKLVKEHPDLDCLVNNAGVQRPLQVLSDDPDEFLQKADQEIDINIRGPMHLGLELLSHFRSKKSAYIVNVGSVLGFLPMSVQNPNYNGTKAWVHFWSTNLRTQLEKTNIKVLEIVPPTVGTNLHRDRNDPDDNKKENNPNALTVEEFISTVEKKWKAGETTISAGMGEELVEVWDREFGSRYQKMTH